MAANRMIRNNPGSVIDIIRMDGIHKTTMDIIMFSTPGSELKCQVFKITSGYFAQKTMRTSTLVHVFLYKKNFYTTMSLKNPKNLRKMLRKSPAWNAWAAIFKNPDFSYSSLEVTKLSKF